MIFDVVDLVDVVTYVTVNKKKLQKNFTICFFFICPTFFQKAAIDRFAY